MSERRGSIIWDVALGYILARFLLAFGGLICILPAMWSKNAQWRALKIVLYVPPLIFASVVVWALAPDFVAAFIAVSLLFILS